MDELTGRQRRFLRSLGAPLTPTVIIGKAGLSDAVVQAVRRALKHHELIKVRAPAGGAEDRRRMAQSLADAVAAVCAGIVGRVILLYLPNRQISPDKQIHLPGRGS